MAGMYMTTHMLFTFMFEQKSKWKFLVQVYLKLSSYWKLQANIALQEQLNWQLNRI